MYLVQLSKSGKYASGKKVAQNTSEYCNFAINTLQLNNLALGASTLPIINVFSATFLPEAYLPDFDSCTKDKVLTSPTTTTCLYFPLPKDNSWVNMKRRQSEDNLL